jgi:hypothetical protein
LPRIHANERELKSGTKKKDEKLKGKSKAKDKTKTSPQMTRMKQMDTDFFGN